MQTGVILSLILLNILIYTTIITNVFILFFLHDTRYFKTMNEFKNIFSSNQFLSILVLAILSMAGMPPLLGFFGKYYIVLFFLKKNHLFFFLIFCFLNFFVIYFYIINIRFLVTKSKKSFFYTKNHTAYLSFPLAVLLVFFFFLNIFGIFFLNDLIIYVVSLCSFYF